MRSRQNTTCEWISLRAGTVVLALTLVVTGCATARPTYSRPSLKPGSWEHDDFSWIRGANYVPTYAHNDVAIWDRFDPEVIDRELGYAEMAGINSVRVFFQIIVYEKDPKRFLRNFETFLRLCDKHHITMEPVLFDSCFGAEPTFEARGWVANPGNSRVAQASWPGCEKYIDDVVGRHIGDPRIVMWDIMNEPMVSGGFSSTPEGRQKIWRFVRHFTEYVNELDPTHATTAGLASVRCFSFVGDVMRVLSFHAYSGDENIHREQIRLAKEEGEMRGKALNVSETGHYALNQSYEMALRVLGEESIGFYIWELMIGRDPFPAVQGIFYPDGTIRSYEDYCAVAGLTKRSTVDQLYPRRGIPEDELRSSISEMLAAPTAEWNLERRLATLHCGALVEQLTMLRIQDEKPGLTRKEIQASARGGDRSLVDWFYEVRGLVGSEFHGQIQKARQLYRDGDAESGFQQLDGLIVDVARSLEISIQGDEGRAADEG